MQKLHRFAWKANDCVLGAELYYEGTGAHIGEVTALHPKNQDGEFSVL